MRKTNLTAPLSWYVYVRHSDIHVPWYRRSISPTPKLSSSAITNRISFTTSHLQRSEAAASRGQSFPRPSRVIHARSLPWRVFAMWRSGSSTKLSAPVLHRSRKFNSDEKRAGGLGTAVAELFGLRVRLRAHLQTCAPACAPSVGNALAPRRIKPKARTTVPDVESRSLVS